MIGWDSINSKDQNKQVKQKDWFSIISLPLANSKGVSFKKMCSRQSSEAILSLWSISSIDFSRSIAL